MAFDDTQRGFKPALRSFGLIEELNYAADNHLEGESTPLAYLQYEGGSFQIEHTPGRPWGDQAVDFLDIEPSMAAR